MKGTQLTDTRMAVYATGEWSISFVPLKEMTFDGTLAGRGNYVSGLFTAAAAENIISATHDGKTLFNVQLVKYDPAGDADFYRKGIDGYGSKRYRELVNLEEGEQYYFVVTADGGWSIDLAQTVTPYSTTVIDHSTHTYSGEGNEIITGVSLPEGQWYAECTYRSAENSKNQHFEGFLFFDTQNKKYWSLGEMTSSGSGQYALSNKCTQFDLQGKSMTGVLQVQSDGKWAVTFRRVQTGASTSFSGKGNTVTKAFCAPADGCSLKIHCEGASSTQVQILEFDPKRKDTRATLVCRETGNVDQTVSLSLKADTYYYLTVETDGTWSLNLTR